MTEEDKQILVIATLSGKAVFGDVEINTRMVEMEITVDIDGNYDQAMGFGFCNTGMYHIRMSDVRNLRFN